MPVTSIDRIKENASLYESNATASKLKSKLNKLSKRIEPEGIDMDLISWKLTKEHTPLAYYYITNRGFTEEEIEKYQIRVGKEYFDPERKWLIKRWKERILFPLFDSGKCVFICGRSYLGKDPKYLNSMGSKQSIVYGLERVQEGKECIIAEGIISAIAAERATGIPAVCLLGKSNSAWALSKIRAKVNRVYLSLDGGVKTTDLRRQLLGLGFEVFEIELPKGKDPDEMGSEYAAYFNQMKKVSVF
jgi:DNA primase